MEHLEVHAHMKIRPGQETGFRTQAAELMRLSRDLDRHTLRYDWFINEEAMDCEVHEAYVSEEGLLEHNEHVVQARELLFREYAYDHQMSVYGPISERLRDLFDKHAGGVRQFSLLEGLEGSPAV